MTVSLSGVLARAGRARADAIVYVPFLVTTTSGSMVMQQVSSLRIRLEYRLAAQLLHARWMTRSPGKHRLTMRLLQRCAEAGHTAALSFYGHMLFHRGNSPQDKAKGARYVFQAAYAGDVHAQYQAGRIYEFGCAQYARREEKAVTWYARAAEAGHGLAAERMAEAYRHAHLGLPVDSRRATQWAALAERAQRSEAGESIASLTH